MKKMRFLILMMLGLIVLGGCAEQDSAFPALDSAVLSQFPSGVKNTVAGSQGLSEFSTVADNGTLRLYYNPRTVEVAVEDIASGVVYRSNHENFSAGAQGAQLILTVYTEKGVRNTWDSNTEAVSYGQFMAETTENGLNVTYVFGETEKVYAVPAAVQVDTFEQRILPLLADASSGIFVKLLYSKVSLSSITSIQQRETLMELYPSLETMDLYVLKSNASTMELKRADETLAAVGYTLEQKAQDEAAAGYVSEAEEQMHVSISVCYTLTDTGLTVEVPASEIAVSGGATVTDVTVLPYFGSPAALGGGFALVPDGMGALIDFSILRDDSYPAYESKVYGRDYANLVTDLVATESEVYLPVLGIHQGAGALTAVVFGGAGYASVVADAPRSGGSPGYCAFKFLLAESTQYSLDAKPENRVTIYQRTANAEMLSVSYRFLPGNTVSYSDMAVAIREELTAKGELPAGSAATQELPLVVKAIGAVDETKLVLGVPVNTVLPLTTFSQMAQIASDLQKASGTSALTLVVAGASAGGLRNTREAAFSPEGALGGTKGYAELREELGTSGATLALAFSGQNVLRDRLFDGFVTNRDAARLLTSAIAYKPEYTLSTMYQDKEGLSAYLLSRDMSEATIRSFITSVAKLGTDTFALTTLGRELYSDQNRGSFTSREAMKESSAALLLEETSSGAAFLSEGANSYLLKYLSLAYDLPVETSPHPLFTEEVPLLQMVLSGHVDYTASDLCYQNDRQTYLLRLMETGSGLYLTAFSAAADTVKYTDFDFLYASNIGVNLEDAANLYKEAVAVLQPVYGLEIVSHERRGDVTRTGYAGGGAVYINYGTQDTEVDWNGESFLLPAGSGLYRKEADVCAEAN